MKSIEISACVSGSIKQVIVLDVEIDESDFVDGLKNGNYVTTISHGENAGKVYEIKPEFRLVGRVIKQTPLDDVEINEFELCGQ